MPVPAPDALPEPEAAPVSEDPVEGVVIERSLERALRFRFVMRFPERRVVAEGEAPAEFVVP